MALSTNVKWALVERFMPLLYLSLDEPDYPVDPTAYVESAALWASAPPGHEKLQWGLPAGADRQPLIERRGISLDPAHDVAGASDPDGDGVPEFYLGQSDDETFPFLTPDDREPWFDLAGWQGGTAVTPASLNRRTEPGPRPPLEQPWFSADVWTLDDLAGQVGAEGMAARFGLAPGDTAPLIEGLVVIAFHFLFPLHRERRRTTALDPLEDPYTGEFEGDWATFAVIARADGEPSEVSSADQVTPHHAAFGHRWRGVDDDYDDGAVERMFVRPWVNVLDVGDHPVVVAAPGTHNLYPHDPPVAPGGSTVKPLFIDWGNSISEPANAIPRDATEEPYSAVLAAKVVAGLALGGLVGLVVGIVAAAAEASWAEEEGLIEAPKLDPNPPPESDNPLVDDWEDLQTKAVAVPPGLGTPPLVDPNQSQIRDWQVPVDHSLVDDSILFGPSPRGVPAYSGRWGVRCTEDSFLRRSGIRFPAHRALVLDALLRRGSS